MKQARISVILPVHDGEKHLEAAVESILAQDFGDFELLVCNDGSRDNTADILAELRKQDPRIQVIGWPEKRGISAALNALTSVAKGEYIARMDADDISLPSRLGTQLAALSGSDGMKVSFAGCELIDENGDYLGVYQPPEKDFDFHLRFRNPFIHPLLFARTDLLRRFGYRDLLYAEDYDLYQRMMQAGVEFHVSSQCLLRYRMVQNPLKDPGKIFSQLLTAAWVRENVRMKVSDPPLDDLARHSRRYERSSFRQRWPTYVSCSGTYFDTRYSWLCYVANYWRLDPLIKSEIRNSIRYRLAAIF